MLRFFTCLLLLCGYAISSHAKGDVEKGAYILKMGGCVSCHQTPKQPNAKLGGGLALKTPFGTFYVPNITPDVDAGIGGWSDDDFITAMTEGVSPEGSHYYPASPYTSYTKMSRTDLIDLKAYIDSVPPIKNAVPDHDLGFPFNLRFLMMGWKMMFFDKGEFQTDPNQSAAWNRGSYIVQGAAHCGECHTPRNIFGGLDTAKLFQGNPKGPDNEKIPTMIPAKWSATDFFTLFRMGMMPDGDFAGGSMGHVIKNTTSKLSREDLTMVVTYINSLKE